MTVTDFVAHRMRFPVFRQILLVAAAGYLQAHAPEPEEEPEDDYVLPGMYI